MTHRDTGKEIRQVKRETEVRIMLPQAKEGQEPPEAGRGKEGSSLEPLDKIPPAQLTQNFSLSRFKAED